MVAESHSTWDFSILRHRRFNRFGRLMEREHHRRGGYLGRHQARSAWPRRLYCQCNRGWRFPSRGARRGCDVGIRGLDEPFVVAPIVRSGGPPFETLAIKEEAMGAVAARTNVREALVAVKKVRHYYRRGTSSNLLVLDNVDLNLYDNEIVALLGRSGSGKSTLLRIISGLMPPSEGVVDIDGQPIKDPADGFPMVFQSFALFPWLTVLENVELGLEAQGVRQDERRERALAAIDLIGLDGFETADPKEISGGLRQRVGLARALVVNPKLLLMDEPFSALDVLTAETLRTDLLDLWCEGRMTIRAILLVTHNIEEAVLMSDRILVFSSNPGRVIAEIKVNLPQPRNRVDPAFRALVDDIYARMTAKSTITPAKEGL